MNTIKNELPLVSVITPTFNTQPRVLKECAESILNQTYPNWEWCIADDYSTDVATLKMLHFLSKRDSRIRVIYRERNGGIVEASNEALHIANGEYIALVDHDDIIEIDALAKVMNHFLADSELDYVYTDEDILNEKGQFVNPFHKPDWSPERFRNQMYTCHLSVIRRSLVEQVGKFQTGFDGSQDYDLILRVTEHARKISHVPAVLYHWRVGEQSLAGNPYAKPYAYLAGEKALQEHCRRMNIDAEVERKVEFPGNYLIRRRVPQPPPVTLFILNSGYSSSIWGLERNHAEETRKNVVALSNYKNFTVKIINYVPNSKLQAINEAILTSNTELCVIIDEACEIINYGPLMSFDWLSALVGISSQIDVAAVSPFLWDENSQLVHAGYSLSSKNIHPIGSMIHQDYSGNRAEFVCDREVSSLSFDLVLIKKSIFQSLNGLSLDLPVLASTIEFFLRIRNSGRRIIATPQANFHFFNSRPDPTYLRFTHQTLMEYLDVPLPDEDPFVVMNSN